MAINERLVHTASAAEGGTGNQEEGLVFHLDANDVDSYDGDGNIWYDIHDYEYTPATNVSEHFNTVLYIGNASTRSITGVGFQPDLVWIKSRSSTYNHGLFDSIRGANKVISSNTTDTENQYGNWTQQLTSFDSDGFSLGDNSDSGNYVNVSNPNTAGYVAWCFKAGGAAVDNTDGDINSSVSANNDLGFSIVKYEGNLTSSTTSTGQSVGHNLGVPPELIIFKSTSNSSSWDVFSSELDNWSTRLQLNSSGQKTDLYSLYPIANPTSSVFYTNYLSSVNVNNYDHIAYCFASKRGVSKVGTYEGNNSSTGVKVYTGFEPAFILFKPVDTSTGWSIYDNQRGIDKQLRPDSNAYEGSGWSAHLEFHRDGFKVKGNSSALNPASTMIYLAFAKNTNETELATTSSGVWSGFQNAVTSITSDSIHPSAAPGVADTATTHSIFDTANSAGMGDLGNAEANNEIFITLNAPKSIRGFAVYEKYSSGYKYTGTTKLYGSYDNSSWNLLGSTVQTTNIERNRNETTFAATPEYQYYKFTLSANTRSTYEQAWAFELIADFDITPSLYLDPASYSGTGTTWAADAGNNGTLVGNTSYDQELGDFFDLDGSGDYISLNSSGYLTGDFTVEMWWNFDTFSGFKMLWGGSGYHNGTGLGHYINGNTLHTYISVSGSTDDPAGQSGAVLTVGKWHHIVLTRSGDTYTQYVDGINVGSGTGSTTSLESANTYIGAHYNNTAYNVDGRVGQVRVYNAALSEEAIRKNFNFTKNDYPNGNNATGNNMDSSDWNSGGYFDFDGSSEYFTTGDLGIRSSALTMSAWVNLNTYSTRAIMMLGSQAGNAGKVILFRTENSGKLALYDGNAVYTTPNVVLTLNTWHHVALAVNGTSYEFFVDGNSEGSVTALKYSGDDTLDIGYYGYGNSQHWDGFMGSIKIYNKTLTSGEILADYNATESTY